MKKSLGILLLSALSFALLIAAGCNLLSTSSDDAEPRIYTVTYLDDDGTELTSREVAKGDCAPELIPKDKSGYEFDYWTRNGKKYEFTYKVTSDLSLTAHRSPIKYTVSFMDGDTEYARRNYTVETQEIAEPAPPVRYGYTCVWESYDLTQLKDLTVRAVYTPVSYPISFYADGILTATLQYTLDDETVDEPEVPAKPGYAGRWERYELTGEEIRVRAEYTPITYYARFYADDELVAERPFHAEKMNVSPPEPPQRDGYTVCWADFALTFEDVDIRAVYTPIKYEVTFIAEDSVVATVSYTAETNEIEEPEIPHKDGYTGNWEPYELTGGNVCVRAVYTLILYYASFYAEGKLVAKLPFHAEDMHVLPPDPPQRDGYTAAWTDFTLTYEDIRVDATYTPIKYTVTFMADGILVAVVPYTAENPDVDLPEVPFKEGYQGEWESFTPEGNIVVHAVYTKNPSSDPEPTVGLEYQRKGDGYAVTGVSTPQRAVVIPSSYNGLPVLAISDNAFANDSTIEELYLCDGVQEICSYAFYYCTRLATVRLPETLLTIGESAFDSCSFTKIIIPDRVTTIKTYAFCHCRNLTQVEIGIGLTTIERLAFYDCTGLTALIIAEPNGWYSSTDGNAASGTEITEIFSDPASAAKYVTENYKFYCRKQTS